MLGGSFTHRLDEVGRFIMPRAFRSLLGQSFVITRGIGCLLVMTEDRFSEIDRRTRGLADPLSVHFDPQLGRLNRQLFAELIKTKVDGQGRVQLTPELRAHAGIDKDLVIVGVGDWIEIWSAENWQAYKASDLTAEQLFEAAAQWFGRKEAGEVDAAVPPSGSSG